MPTRNPGAQVSGTPYPWPELTLPFMTDSRLWPCRPVCERRQDRWQAYRRSPDMPRPIVVTRWRFPSCPTISTCLTNESTKPSTTSSELSWTTVPRNKGVLVWCGRPARERQGQRRTRVQAVNFIQHLQTVLPLQAFGRAMGPVQHTTTLYKSPRHAL